MDFQLSDQQGALVDAVHALLQRHAGPQRARQLGGRRASYDHSLEAALADAGFLDLHAHPDAGPLEAALVVEEVSKAAGLVAAGARGLVAPGVSGDSFPAPIALAEADDPRPVRFGAHAVTLLVAGPDQARVVTLDAASSEPVDSVYGYPMARVATDGGTGLGCGSAARLRAWWRVALAVEMAGAMQSALTITVAYVRERHQFGKPIGSLQAVQHRLAEAAVLVEGTRWLALEAAWAGAPDAAAATAATHAAAAAQRVSTDMHQLTGAIGFTSEYDLQTWTMRLQALRLELGGVARHSRAVATSRWTGDAA